MSALTQARAAFGRIFALSKEAVVVYVVSFVRNSQDDTVLTVSSTNNTYAKVDRGSEQDIYTDAGTLANADFVMYFPHSYTTGLSEGNYIDYDSRTYKIERVSEYRLADGLVYTKLFLKESNQVLA